MSSKTTRDEIIEAADDLFYRQGYEHTSFTDIANVVKISRGNFYHHFKSKDEILDAVIDKRLADRQAMLQRWEIEGETPEDRIRSFIDILIVHGEKIKRYGCPIGTLTSELAKLNRTRRRQPAVWAVQDLASQAVRGARPSGRRRHACNAPSWPHPGGHDAVECL